MTIGIQLLRKAKDQLEAAIAAIKDELKNPDTADIVKDQVPEIGSEFDLHLVHLADQFHHEPSAPVNIQDAEAAGDKGEDAPPAGDPSLPAKIVTEEQSGEIRELDIPTAIKREGFIEKFENAVDRAAQTVGERIGEAKFGE